MIAFSGQITAFYRYNLYDMDDIFYLLDAGHKPRFGMPPAGYAPGSRVAGAQFSPAPVAFRRLMPHRSKFKHVRKR